MPVFEPYELIPRGPLAASHLAEAPARPARPAKPPAKLMQYQLGIRPDTFEGLFTGARSMSKPKLGGILGGLAGAALLTGLIFAGRESK